MVTEPTAVVVPWVAGLQQVLKKLGCHAGQLPLFAGPRSTYRQRVNQLQIKINMNTKQNGNKNLIKLNYKSNEYEEAMIPKQLIGLQVVLTLSAGSVRAVWYLEKAK